MKVRIAPSLLSADFARLADALAAVEAGGADLVHVDVMDGHFVPNLTIGPPVVRALRKATRLPLDVHLMIERPEATLAEYIDAGANWISVHVEATDHLQRCLDLIRRSGVKAGAAINPATPTLALSAAYDDLDYAVVMSVNPGWGGQPFLPGSPEKVRRLETEARAGSGRRLTIEVDGGVTKANAGELVAAGAEILVAGTAIYGADDPAAAIGQLRDAAVATVQA
jgi:ribulose-phosphate 3-epimerase